MKNEMKIWLFPLCLICGMPWAAAQTTLSSSTPPTSMAASAATVVPALIPYSGTARDRHGNALVGERSISFLIYKEQQGGEALFAETQAVTPDMSGQYEVQLGATGANGIPIDLFASGDARWLEVQIAGEQPQPRILLLSVPYALKAADAATLGGLPASAFALAESNTAIVNAAAAAISPDAATTVTTTGGTTNMVAKFTGKSMIANSILFDNGTEVGIRTTSPNATLTVDGTFTVDGVSTLNGQVSLAATGVATSSKSFDSQSLKFSTSAYDSSTKAVVPPRFVLQAEPTGNDTRGPKATLNVLASTTSSSPMETGLYFNSEGIIHFASGQTFPGTGDGTITGVTAGTDLTGGGTSGKVTLNLDTTKIPTLGAANSFTGNQTILAGDLNLPSTTSASNGVINIGGVPFLHGYKSGSNNVFVGGAGNFKATGTSNEGSGHSVLKALTSGTFNTGSGESSLAANTTGSDNTAFGANTLPLNTTGTENTAVGDDALFYSSTGSNNTAVGEEALFNNFNGSNNTAIGAFTGTGQAGGLTNVTAIGYSSTVQQNNTLVLGMTQAGTPGAQFVNVGIGTAQPRSVIEAAVSAPGALGPVLTLTNTGSGTNTAAGIQFYTGSSDVGAFITAFDDGLGDGGTNLGIGAKQVSASDLFVNTMEIETSENEAKASLLVQASNGNDGADFFGGGPGGESLGGGAGGYFEGGPSGSSAGSGAIFVGGMGTGVPNNGFGYGGDGLTAFPGTPGPPNVTGDQPAAYAGVFNGDILVDGTQFSDVMATRIDDPLDPANKYFIHTSVQSSEMMNIYSGNATTNELGLATVALPDWFETENGDFRYQLTVIGGRFAQAIVSKEIADHQFTIATNASNVKVSWQITGVRQDVYAKAHPMRVEVTKSDRERGYYAHPELYGQPEEKQTEWGRSPQLMQRVRAQREAARLRGTKREKSVAMRPQFGPPASAVNRQFALTPRRRLKSIAGSTP